MGFQVFALWSCAFIGSGSTAVLTKGHNSVNCHRIQMILNHESIN